MGVMLLWRFWGPALAMACMASLRWWGGWRLAQDCLEVSGLQSQAVYSCLSFALATMMATTMYLWFRSYAVADQYITTLQERSTMAPVCVPTSSLVHQGAVYPFGGSRTSSGCWAVCISHAAAMTFISMMRLERNLLA